MTHTAKHTPGPWVAMGKSVWGDPNNRAISAPCIDLIANTSTGRSEVENHANANLIAAAPAMYEALKETMQVLRSLRDNKEEWYTLVTPELLSAWDKNKQALSQAEGKQ